MATDELAAKLNRRNKLIVDAEDGEPVDLPTSSVDAHLAERKISTSDSAATDELANKLNRRNKAIEDDEEGREPEMPSMKVWNPYTEFKEFSRKQIQFYQKTFKQYDENQDKFICFHDLKRMMEKLGCAQTHLALKEMIREVDEDKDDKISLREFLLIFHKAAAGELSEDSGLMDLYNSINEIDVAEAGVGGAKGFFEAKINEQTKSSKFEEEIKQEQEEKRVELEEKKKRRAEFKEKASMWK